MGDIWTAPFKLFEVIAKNLDDAEYNSEYNNGLETLRRGLTQFDLSLEQNPDWRSYPELAAKAEQDLWQQVDQQTKNQGAKNDLQSTWMQLRDQHLAKVGDLSNTVRIQTYHADLTKRMEQRAKDVEAGTLSAADAQTANEADLKQAGQTRVIHPDEALQSSNDFATEVQYLEASRKLRAIGAAEGWDSAMKAVGPTVGQYDHLNATHADKLMNELQRYSTISRAEYNRKVKDNNGKIEDNVMKALLDGDIGKANRVLKDGKFMDEEGGLSAADNQYQWFQRIHTYAQDELANKRALEKDNPTADGFLADATNENINPEVTFSNARDAMLHHQITQAQYKAVQSALSPRIKARVAAYEELFKTDTSMAPELVNRLKTAQGYFRSWAADNMDASDEEISKQAQSFHKQALDKELFNNLSSYYSAQREAMSEAKAGKPLEMTSLSPVTNPSPEVDYLTKKGIAGVSYYGSDKGGKAVYRDKDGAYYFKDPKSGVWYVNKDGKTWQTLK